MAESVCLIDAAAEAGVQHVILQSAIGASDQLLTARMGGDAALLLRRRLEALSHVRGGLGTIAQALLVADVRLGFEVARGFIDSHSASEGALLEMLGSSGGAGGDGAEAVVVDDARALRA